MSLITCALLSTSLFANVNIGDITVYSVTKSEQSIKDVTADISVITKEELDEKNYTTVSQALHSIVGLSLTSNGGIGQQDNLYIRGVESKRILILVDGIRYNNPLETIGAPLATLLINDIERIEVLKGAQSGIWGADASGGVINIISSSSKIGTHGSILIERGSFNTQKLGATLSKVEKKYFVKINVNKTSSDGISAFEAKQGSADYGKRGNELGLEKDGFETKTFNVRAGLNITDNDALTLNYKKILSDYDYDSSSSDNSVKESESRHQLKSIKYSHKKDIYTIDLFASQSKFHKIQGDLSTSPTPKRSLVNEFSIQNTIKYQKSSTLVLGLNKQNFENIVDKDKYNTKAIFISNYNKFDNLLISEVFRHDNNSKFEEKMTGKLGAKYFFTQDFTVSSNYGTAYTAPSLRQLNYTSTLAPESSKSFDLNVEYKAFKVSYYKTKIDDMIEYVSGSSPTQYENREGTTILKGYELSYNDIIIDDLLFNINYVRLSAKDSDNKNLRRRAKETLNLGFDYYGISKFHFNINGSYVGERYNSDGSTGAQTGRYSLANAVINYEVNNNLKIYVKIDNITDKFYQTVDGYGTPGRSAYVGLKASF